MNGKNVVDFKFGLFCDILQVESYDCLHRHNEIEILFYQLDQPMVFRFGSRLIELHNDQTALFWGAIPHQLVSIESDNIQYWVAIPPEIFLSLDLPAALVQEVMNGRVLLESDRDLRDMDVAEFKLWKRETKNGSAESRRTMLLSLEARLRRFHYTTTSSHSPRGGTPKHLSSRDSGSFQKMYDFITLNFRNPIRVEEIAEEVNLHPNYAISLFKSKCGINIIDLVTMLRIYESQRLLLTTDQKIIDVAMDAGFGSMSNFYKSFKRLCGKNPHEYRNLRIE